MNRYNLRQISPTGYVTIKTAAHLLQRSDQRRWDQSELPDTPDEIDMVRAGAGRMVRSDRQTPQRGLVSNRSGITSTGTVTPEAVRDYVTSVAGEPRK